VDDAEGGKKPKKKKAKKAKKDGKGGAKKGGRKKKLGRFGPKHLAGLNYLGVEALLLLVSRPRDSDLCSFVCLV
jgi:hypothetical protein